MINNLPVEILLDIFDSCLQSIKPHYGQLWWLKVAHVCRRWRAVISASASRLDIGINVGPKNPDDMETILSGPWPILIDYRCKYEYYTDSSLKRMHSALEHHDRVRGIYLNGSSWWFDDFFKATSCPFPALESLYLRNENDELEISDTFLGGPDLSDLRLRSLTLRKVSLTPISGLLSSATSLTDLVLELYTSFTPSAGMTLLASLQGMPCLCNLDLEFKPVNSLSRPLIPKDVVPLSKLTKLRYVGGSVFLYALVAGLSAPSLQKVNIEFRDAVPSPTVHLSRFINEIEEHYHYIHVSIQRWSAFNHMLNFSISLHTPEQDYWEHELGLESIPDPRLFPESMLQWSDALSARLATVEVLRVTFGDIPTDYVWEDYLPWRRFYRHFSSVKTLRIPHSMARMLYQYHGEPDDLFVLPALEEIDLSESLTDESERAALLAAFQPFVNARQQAGGRLINVFFLPGRPSCST